MTDEYAASLPLLRADQAVWQLPLAEATALAWLRAWLEPAQPATIESWLVALRRDPAPLIWLACQPHGPLAAGPADWPSVSSWLLGPAQEIYARQAIAASAPAPHDRRWAAQQAERDRARLAAIEPAPGIQEVATLLNSAHQWLDRFRLPGQAAGPCPLPQWLTTAVVGAEAGFLEPTAAPIEANAAPPPCQAPANASAGSLLAPLARRLQASQATDREFQQAVLREKLESLAEFAAGAGHEMNNPLAVISGRAQLWLRGETDPARRRELAAVHVQALRVHDMIADLMLFARPPAPKPVACDLATLARQALAEVAETAAQRGLVLRGPAAAGECWAWCDPLQIAVALRAMLDNALRALPPGCAIEISPEPAASPAAAFLGPAPEAPSAIGSAGEGQLWVWLVVRDNGPGLAPEVARHLFDPYYSGYPAGRGLGLGLSKSWRIAQQHSGELTVHARPEGGVEFRLRLPRLRERTPAEPAEPQSPAGGPSPPGSCSDLPGENAD